MLRTISTLQTLAKRVRRLLVPTALLALTIILQGCNGQLDTFKNLKCGEITSDTISIQLREEQVGVFQAVFQSRGAFKQIRLGELDPTLVRNPTQANVQAFIANVLGGWIDDFVAQGWGKTGRNSLEAIRRCSTFKDGGQVCAAKFQFNIKQFIVSELPQLIIERIQDRTVRRAARFMSFAIYIEKACTGSCVLEKAYDKATGSSGKRCAPAPRPVAQGSAGPRAAYFIQREGHPAARIVGAGDANGDGYVNAKDIEATRSGNVQCALAVAAVAEGSAPGTPVACTLEESLELERTVLWLASGSESALSSAETQSSSEPSSLNSDEASTSSTGSQGSSSSTGASQSPTLD